MNKTIFLIFFILSTIFAAFFTLVEFSLLRLKRTRIKELIEHKSHEDWLQIWLRRAEIFWLTSLVVGTIARIVAGIALYVIVHEISAFSVLPAAILTVAAVTIIVVIFTEILPRAIGRVYGERCARYLLTPMYILSLFFWPLTLPFHGLIRIAGRFISIREALNPVADFEKDIIEILENSDKSIQLEEDEKELISSVVEFTETIVREVMVPRVDIIAVESTSTLKEIHQKIMETGHTRIPIYKDTIDNIVGFFYAKDLLKFFNHGSLETHLAAEEMHEPIFVPETKNVNDLLREFQQKKMNIAVVVDEFGGTAGLVTIKDLLEEIVGEIKDEDDKEKPLFAEMPDGAFIVDAKMPIDEIVREIGLQIPVSAEYDTIGGYIYTALGKIPHKDEIFQRDGAIIKIVDVDDRRIHKVVLKKSADRSNGR